MTRISRVHAAGGPEVPSWDFVDVAAPGPAELRVRQTAIGITTATCAIAAVCTRCRLPFTPGVADAATAHRDLEARRTCSAVVFTPFSSETV